MRGADGGWQWSHHQLVLYDTLTWEDAEGMGVETTAYTPESDDEGKCLRVTASYTDAQGAGKTSMDVSGQPVQKVRNLAPVFTDEDAATAGIQVMAREVDENSDATDATDNVGAPVLATDTEDGEMGDNNGITYRLSGADAASFTIAVVQPVIARRSDHGRGQRHAGLRGGEKHLHGDGDGHGPGGAQLLG